jgi:hypothetical protein
VVTFSVNKNTLAVTTVINLENQPVPGEVSSVLAEPLTATWTAATITINDPTSVNEGEDATVPTVFALEQNFPNPFNPSTTIAFSLPRQSRVTLKVFNVVGEEISTLVDQELSAGRYEAHWDAGQMNGGVYFYRLQAGAFVQTRKLILIR